MLVRSGCVGPRNAVPALGGGEGWVGRPPDALAQSFFSYVIHIIHTFLHNPQKVAISAHRVAISEVGAGLKSPKPETCKILVASGRLVSRYSENMQLRNTLRVQGA